MNMDTLLISGAHGFLGRHCALKFKNTGWKSVIGVGNGEWQKHDYISWGIDQWIPMNISLKALEGINIVPNCIVHCAGGSSVKESLDNPFTDFQRTVQSTLSILEFCKLHSKNTTIIFPSSAAVYGKTDNLPIKETENLNPVSTYGLHKKIAEEIILNYTHRYHLKTGIIRFFSLYGSELKKQLIWDACQKIKHKDVKFFGSGEETRDFLYIDDAVQLIKILSTEIEKKPGLIVNGGAGVGVSIRSTVQIILSCFNTQTQPVFINDKREGDPDHYIADISRARNIGWRPGIKLEHGIEKYVQWYQKLEK